jgi:hypothetical protein
MRRRRFGSSVRTFRRTACCRALPTIAPVCRAISLVGRRRRICWQKANKERAPFHRCRRLSHSPSTTTCQCWYPSTTHQTLDAIDRSIPATIHSSHRKRNCWSNANVVGAHERRSTTRNRLFPPPSQLITHTRRCLDRKQHLDYEIVLDQLYPISGKCVVRFETKFLIVVVYLQSYFASIDIDFL